MRTAYMLVAGQELEGGPKVAEARGAEGVRRFTVTAGDAQLNLAVVNGLGRVKESVDGLLAPEAGMHFVEVMSCPGGCIGGGGQPYDTDAQAVKERLERLYEVDRRSRARRSHENADVQALYEELLGRPLGEVSHRLLHRAYTAAAPTGPRSEGADMSGTIITTIKQNCRRCYTCVRDCPAEAIRIEDGQAFVVDGRCIACGNCTLVCSQNAKAYLSGLERATWLLEEDAPVAALLAPSFPAGFSVPAGQLVGAFKAAGFDHVVEVAQGADLVSRAYTEYLQENPTGVHIATACPAVSEYVRKYHPEMVDTARADRVPDDRHGAGRQGALRRRRALRVHRTVRRQEGGGARPAAAAGHRRGADAAGGAHVCWRLAAWTPRRPRRRRGTSRPPGGRGCSRFPAACSRAPRWTAASSIPTSSWSAATTRPWRCWTASARPTRARPCSWRPSCAAAATAGRASVPPSPASCASGASASTSPSAGAVRPRRPRRCATRPATRLRRGSPDSSSAGPTRPTTSAWRSRPRTRSARSSREPTSSSPRTSSTAAPAAIPPAAPRRSPCTPAWPRTPCACRS